MRILRLKLRCWLRGHRWQTIITSQEGTHDKQRCSRCGHYRTLRLSQHQQAKRAS